MNFNHKTYHIQQPAQRRQGQYGDTLRGLFGCVADLLPFAPTRLRLKQGARWQSRATAGIRKGTLIVNLPGSPKAVRECLEVIIEALGHGIEILTGDAGECGR